MSRFCFTAFLIHAAVFFGFVISGWLTWFAALWFVDYAKMHGTSVPLVETVALIITVIGVVPMLIVGAVSGVVAVLWITRKRVYDINTA